MKYLSLVVLFLFCSCSISKRGIEPNGPTFKTIRVASYAVEKWGELDRVLALKDRLVRIEYYNEKGFLIQYIKYDLDGSLYETTHLQKNDQGTLLSGVSLDVYGDTSRYWITNLNKEGRIVRQQTFNGEGDLMYTQSSSYDDLGNEIVRKWDDLEYRFTYNTKGQVVKEISNSTRSGYNYIQRFRYDDEGNLIEAHQLKSDGTWTNSLAEYDTYNNQIQTVEYNAIGEQISRTSYDYTYDRFGHWLTRNRRVDGVLEEVEERGIEYY